MGGGGGAGRRSILEVNYGEASVRVPTRNSGIHHKGGATLRGLRGSKSTHVSLKRHDYDLVLSSDLLDKVCGLPHFGRRRGGGREKVL